MWEGLFLGLGLLGHWVWINIISGGISGDGLDVAVTIPEQGLNFGVLESSDYQGHRSEKAALLGGRLGKHLGKWIFHQSALATPRYFHPSFHWGLRQWLSTHRAKGFWSTFLRGEGIS